MKMIRRGVSAALVLCALFAIPAFANEVLNIPASAAHPDLNNPDNNCYIDNGGSFYAFTQSPESCKVFFPITIPVGRTIKQISVIHGTSYPNLPNPGISAYLRIVQMPHNQEIKFAWNSLIPVPNSTYEASRLMAQPVFPKNTFPDAFVVQSDSLYDVEVILVDLSYVVGLQITYE